MTDRLKDWHKQVVQLTAQGIAQNKIAAQVGKSVRQVRAIQQVPLVQVLVREEQQKALQPGEAQVLQKLLDALPEAVDILIEQMRYGESTAVRRAAAKTVIETAGRSVRQFGRTESERETWVIGTGDMVQMQELLDEARAIDTQATNIPMQPTEA